MVPHVRGRKKEWGTGIKELKIRELRMFPS